MDGPTNTVADITDEQLIRRAIMNARWKNGEPRWAAVANAFSLGSTYAIQLCRRFNVDPDKPKPQR